MIEISATLDGPPWPLPLRIAFTCDGDHGLLPSPTFIREGHVGYVEVAHDATVRGWKLTSERHLCPECR